jgi:phenylalanine-4-hydroxylase
MYLKALHKLAAQLSEVEQSLHHYRKRKRAFWQQLFSLQSQVLMKKHCYQSFHQLLVIFVFILRLVAFTPLDC